MLDYYIKNLPPVDKKKSNRWLSLEDPNKDVSSPLSKINLKFKIIMQLQASLYGESYLIQIENEEMKNDD